MRPIALCGLLVVVSGFAARVDAQRMTYFGGVSYSGGSYVFDARSHTFFFSNGLRLDLGRVDVGVSVPLVTQNGGLITSVAGDVPLPTGGSQSGFVRDRTSGQTLGTRKGRRSGDTMMADSTLVFVDEYSTELGDPYLSVSGELFSGFGTVRSFALRGSAKTPVADPESGAGSGAWDFGVGASAIVAAGGVLLLADAAYWWLGDMPDLELRDALSYALGGSVPAFSGRGSLMLMLSGMSRTIEAMEPPLSLSASLSRFAGDRTYLSAGAGIGLTESAPDFSVNLAWSIRIGG